MLAIKDEVMDIGAEWSTRVRTMPIIEGVNVRIYNGKESVLCINGQDVIEFSWTAEAKRMFEEIDVAEPIELLELLQRLHIN